MRCTYLHHAQQLHEVGRAVAERGGDLHESVDAPPHSSRSCATRARRVLLLEVMGVSADTDMTYQRMLIDFGKLIMAIGAPREAVTPAERTEQRLIARSSAR